MNWKIDMSIDWQGMFKEYLQTYETMKRGLVPTESNSMPDLETYFMTEIMKQAQADLRELIFKGVYNSSGSAYGHLAVLDGFVKILKAASLLGTPDIVATSAVVTSAANALPKIKTMYQGLGSAWRNSSDAIILVASDVWFNVTDAASGFGTTAPTIVINNGNRSEIANDIISYPLPFARNVKLMEEPNLPTGGMLATVKRNLVVGFDTLDPSASLRMEREKRLVNILGDGMLGVQIRRIKATTKGAPIVVNEALIA
jgi:hypothetical protein